jgi:hypothetical protein
MPFMARAMSASVIYVLLPAAFALGIEPIEFR